MHSIPIVIIDLLALLIGVTVAVFLMWFAPVWAVVVIGFLLVYFLSLYPLR